MLVSEGGKKRVSEEQRMAAAGGVGVAHVRSEVMAAPL